MSGLDLRGARILLTTDAVGGVWTYTLDLAAGLAALGAVVGVVALGPPVSAGQRAEAERRGLDVRHLPHPLEWLAAGPGEVRAAAAALAGEAGRRGADLVHLHGPAFAAAAYRCPVVAVHHSCVATWWAAVRAGPLPPDLAWRAALVGDGLARADLVLAPSRSHAEAVARCYRLAAAPLAVANGRAAPPGGSENVPERDEVFTAGRLWDEGKNLAALDRAASRLPWPVRAAGDAAGPNGARVDLPSLSLLGPCSQAEVRRHLAGRPIYASPARYEPFGLAVLEAAQAGCPLVLGDIPAARELWNGAALFADGADDADALAAALRGLIEDRDARRAAGEAARRRAAAYTVEAMVAGTAAAYAACLDGAGPGRAAAPAA